MGILPISLEAEASRPGERCIRGAKVTPEHVEEDQTGRSEEFRAPGGSAQPTTPRYSRGVVRGGAVASPLQTELAVGRLTATLARMAALLLLQ
jgi:hypothetical protein